MSIQNPHDKMFKETFSNIEVAKDFMNNYLPKEILNLVDIDTLEMEKDSFIDEDLNETFSDLLFGVNINNKDGYIYFLFEHKSYRSKNISFQLLKYMVEIWELKVKKEYRDKLPIIIPLVIYHGKEGWNIKNSLGEMIEGYEELSSYIKEFVPNYKYLIYDISRYNDEDIKGMAKLRIILTVFRDIFKKDKDGLKQTINLAAKYLREIEDKETGIEYFETFLKYIFNAGKSFTDEDIQEIIVDIERVYPEGRELIMTTAERLRKEGLERGRKEGLEKGLKTGLVNTANKLLTKKFGKLPTEVMEKIDNLNPSTLEVLIEDIFSYEKLEDIDKYLN